MRTWSSRFARRKSAETLWQPPRSQTMSTKATSCTPPVSNVRLNHGQARNMLEMSDVERTEFRAESNCRRRDQRIKGTQVVRQLQRRIGEERAKHVCLLRPENIERGEELFHLLALCRVTATVQ